MRINEIKLRKILNSRTNYTVEAEINGEKASAPSGASTGSHEAKCFVPEHLEETEELLKKLESLDITQEEFDRKLKDLDDTDDFSRIGAAGIAASFAFKQLNGFNHSNKFPIPLSNVIGGGEHGGNTVIQEFLVLPTKPESFHKALETNRKIYNELKEKYSRKIQGVNDEGALITSMDDAKTLKALKRIADKHDAQIGLDIAASELYQNGKYNTKGLAGEIDGDEMLDLVDRLINEFDLSYVEDPFYEDDFRNHARLTSKHSDVLICGDDLFVTNKQRLTEGIENGSCNSLIVKPNQVGTVTGAKETVQKAKENDYTPVISHRSGETCDSTISDLALEWECPIIKAGIADIRIAKLNQLLRLWNNNQSAEIGLR